MTAELTIGDFSRITHLSIKTLRYYHRVGLLEPADVNDATGYRYYALGQVPVAQSIRRYRDLGLPVDDVRAVLAAPDAGSRDALLAAHLDRLHEQLTQTQVAVASLRDLLEHPVLPIDVQLRRVVPTPSLAISTTIERDNLIEWWTGAMAELRETLTAGSLRATGAPGGLYADGLFTDDYGDAVVFIPVAEPVTRGRVRPFTVPGAELAVTELRGPHDDVDRVYGALGTWATERGHGASGPVREYYRAQPDAVADWITEICWPLPVGAIITR
jgi:DNA-binding transcriptional MerR regulator/effector-binding domain-containing protein